MDSRKRSLWYRGCEWLTPSIVKAVVKRVYWSTIRRYHRLSRIDRGRFVEFGYRFRFDCRPPHRAIVGDRSVADAFNVWNASAGDIVVGRKCWFGLYNILMGPVEIGDRLSTGPFVCILGPRHPSLEYEQLQTKEKTRIGHGVWISTGATVLFGVTIGDGAVISAGCVVSQDVPANSVLVQRSQSFLVPRLES
jgi:acetyltransferase-like isoleucine patch superfamily enzyme